MKINYLQLTLRGMDESSGGINTSWSPICNSAPEKIASDYHNIKNKIKEIENNKFT